MSLIPFKNPKELSDHLEEIGNHCEDGCIGEIKNNVNLDNKVNFVASHPCFPLEVAITNSVNKPDQTHEIVTGLNKDVEAGLKGVVISNIDGVTIINGDFEIGDGRRPDTISFDATELDGARGLLPEIKVAGGHWQWIGLKPIKEY